MSRNSSAHTRLRSRPRPCVRASLGLESGFKFELERPGILRQPQQKGLSETRLGYQRRVPKGPGPSQRTSTGLKWYFATNSLHTSNANALNAEALACVGVGVGVLRQDCQSVTPPPLSLSWKPVRTARIQGMWRVHEQHTACVSATRCIRTGMSPAQR